MQNHQIFQVIFTRQRQQRVPCEAHHQPTEPACERTGMGQELAPTKSNTRYTLYKFASRMRDTLLLRIEFIKNALLSWDPIRTQLPINIPKIEFDALTVPGQL